MWFVIQNDAFDNIFDRGDESGEEIGSFDFGGIIV
jgi:hypothetical protein